jgi:hypothetical protein
LKTCGLLGRHLIIKCHRTDNISLKGLTIKISLGKISPENGVPVLSKYL